MSILTYNGITLPYPISTQFDQQAVYDDSGTDLMYTKIVIQVECVINSAYMAQIYPSYADADVPDNAAAIMAWMRSQLLVPRKSLSFKCGTFELLPKRLAGNAGYVDAKNGPRPIDCVPIRLNSVTFLLRYHIEAHYWENNELNRDGWSITNKPGSPAVSHRWEESVSMDNCMVTTKTRKGTVVLRTDNPQGLVADDLRSTMATLGLANGYLRKSSNYAVTPDGTKLHYTITDEEYFKLPPQPAYFADGYYKETTSPGGAVRYGECSVTLKGCNDQTVSAQNELARVAIIIVGGKLKINGGISAPVKGFALLRGAELKVSMWKNEVTFTASMMLTGKRQRVVGIPLGPNPFGDGIAQGGFVYVPFVDRPDVAGIPGVPTPPENKPPTYYNRGSAGYLLTVARYYDPSATDNALTGTPQASTGVIPGDEVSGNQLPRGKQPGQEGKGGL